MMELTLASCDLAVSRSDSIVYDMQFASLEEVAAEESISLSDHHHTLPDLDPSPGVT